MQREQSITLVLKQHRLLGLFTTVNSIGTTYVDGIGQAVMSRESEYLRLASK